MNPERTRTDSGAPPPASPPPQLARIEVALRRLLGSPMLSVRTPAHRDATLEIWVGRRFVGTLDLDADGDLVATIPVLREDLAGVGR